MEEKTTYLFVKTNDGVKGPFTKRQIYQLFEQKKINEDTIVGAAYEGEQPQADTFLKLKDSRTYSQFSSIRTSHIVLTTETSFPPNVIGKRLGVITAECAFGMNLFKDFFAGVRDLVGGRSEATQQVLRDARQTVLTELKNEAFLINADAVIAVDLDYSEFSGGGKSMLFIVASGTAVILSAPI